MSGSANIDKVFELLDIEKAVDVNTLSGWIMEELGQIPKEGDSFVSDGVKVVVLKMDDHRVDKAKVYQNVQNNAENEGNQENNSKNIRIMQKSFKKLLDGKNKIDYNA